MRIVFISINQGRQLFDPRGPAGEITFPMNCRGEIIPFPSDIPRFSRGTGRVAIRHPFMALDQRLKETRDYVDAIIHPRLMH
jgi:hypothetical protein